MIEASPNKEEIRQLFSEEHLASLSLEEYIDLLRLYPSEFVTSALRQGVRDHGWYEHNRGMGEFHNSVVHIFRSKRLRSAIGVCNHKEDQDEAIAYILDLESCASKEEAIRRLEVMCNPNMQGDAGTFSDRNSIHVSAEEVSDAFYGAEKYNEVFIIHPSLHVASQYNFSGALNVSGGDVHNNSWIWTSEKDGMNVDAGIVFLPRDVLVDRNTGSRYFLDEERKPKLNKEGRDVLTRFINDDNFNDFVERALPVIGSLKRKEEGLEKLDTELSENFGISNNRLRTAILDYFNLESLRGGDINSVLESASLMFIESQDTIPAQQFWDKYFDANPESRPSKVVYYNGDPTQAFLNWKEENGLDKKSDSSDMGFPENRVDALDDEATLGMEEFKARAVSVIDAYFEN